MSFLTKQTYYARCKRLTDLRRDIEFVYGRACQLHNHAPPYESGKKGSDFFKNFHYKSTLELIKAGTWVLWRMTRSAIEEYEKDEATKIPKRKRGSKS